ncbi:MAG: C4-type zinc ribbon domain-containing protein [Myxococcota bacterium]|nr:C4-type zinc ribbon domain-containing protein [Myxococcota bacterium]
MKEQIRRLRELQALDLERDRLSEDVEKLRSKLGEATSLLDSLLGALNAQKAQLQETKLTHATKVAERNKAEHDHNEAKSKFRNVTNSREYAAAEREMETFRKISTQLEEEVSSLSAAIEVAEASIASMEEKVNGLEQELEAERASVEEAAQIAVSKSSGIEERTKALAVGIRADIITRYRFIRSRRAGEAVVAAVDGACTGCFMRVPPQLYIRLQKRDTLEVCENCQRILFFPEEAEEAASAS